jgi:hypothetical protein
MFMRVAGSPAGALAHNPMPHLPKGTATEWSVSTTLRTLT